MPNRRFMYGSILTRAGRVKYTNDPELANKLGISAYWNNIGVPTATTVHNISNDKISKYSKKNVRKQCERVSNTKKEEPLGAKIDKLEFHMEKKMYNDFRSRFWYVECANPKNHKKWKQNHRQAYSNREIIHQF